MIIFYLFEMLMIGSISLIQNIVESSSSSEAETSSDEEFLLLLSELKSKKHTKIKNYIQVVVPRYDDVDFKAHFRLTRPVVEVNSFISSCSPYMMVYTIFFQIILRDLRFEDMEGYVTKPHVTPQHAFLLTLWVLANQESFRCVADRFGLSRGHAHTVFIKTIKKMYEARKRYIKWPQSLRDTVRDFTALRANPFPNVVGCVDGTHILISGPRADDSFYNRKGTHSMLVQVRGHNSFIRELF